jgi:hypothetical protein
MDAGILAAILRGEIQEISDALVTAADDQGLAALVAASPSGAVAPATIASRLRRILADAEALSMLRTRELRRVLDALASAGLKAVVIKGAHLAHAIYSSPALRPRTDTDLAIDQRDHERAAQALHALGYRRIVHVRGSLILGQCHFESVDATGVEHAIDLHWRVAAPLVLRDVRTPSALLRDAVPIAALGSAAIGPALHDALIIACVHLVAHHREMPRLLWLHDIALLARALDAGAAERFALIAQLERVRALCGVALRRAHEFSPDEALAGVIARLDALPAREEPSARLLETNRKAGELWLDLRAARSWDERLVLVKEHAWPDVDYMRATHGQAWLPFAYARRAFRGALRWMQPTSPSDRTAGPGAPPAGSAAASALPPDGRTTPPAAAGVRASAPSPPAGSRGR